MISRQLYRTLYYNSFLFILPFLIPNSVMSQECSPTTALISAYQEDVKVMALERMVNSGTADTASLVVLPEYETDIWTALTAAFLDSSHDTDSVFDIFCIHKNYTRFNKHWIYVWVDTSIGWTANWVNGLSFSGHAPIDSILEGHEYMVTNFGFNPAALRLEFEEILNLDALVTFLELHEGVVFSERVPTFGESDQIIYEETGNTVIMHFVLGWGDCPAGCTGERTWMFEIDLENCYVSYIWSFGSNVNVDIPGIGQPWQVNCNLSTNTLEESTDDRIQIYPNPVADLLSFDSKSRVYSYAISNSMGIIHQSNKLSPDQFIINIASASSGIYFIAFYQENGNKTIYKFIKQ